MGRVSEFVRKDADVAGVVERLRFAEAHLQRRRQSICGPSETDRTAFRHVCEAYDLGDPLTATQLSRRLAVSTASTTAILDRLTGVGLVTRRPHPRDRRAIIIEPTDRRRDMEDIDPLSKRIAEAARELDHDESQIVARFLTRVADLVDEEC